MSDTSTTNSNDSINKEGLFRKRNVDDGAPDIMPASSEDTEDSTHAANHGRPPVLEIEYGGPKEDPGKKRKWAATVANNVGNVFLAVTPVALGVAAVAVPHALAVGDAAAVTLMTAGKLSAALVVGSHMSNVKGTVDLKGGQKKLAGDLKAFQAVVTEGMEDVGIRQEHLAIQQEELSEGLVVVTDGLEVVKVQQQHLVIQQERLATHQKNSAIQHENLSAKVDTLQKSTDTLQKSTDTLQKSNDHLTTLVHALIEQGEARDEAAAKTNEAVQELIQQGKDRDAVAAKTNEAVQELLKQGNARNEAATRA